MAFVTSYNKEINTRFGHYLIQMEIKRYIQDLNLFIFSKPRVPSLWCACPWLYAKRSQVETRPAWAGFKTAEEGRAKICKILWQKL